jgi:hypothetical protein
MVFSGGRTRIGLTNQQTIVRVVLQDAIERVHAHLLFYHAFPDPSAALASTRGALVDAAKARFPGAAVIRERLQSDEEYMLNMSVIVSIT